MFNEKNLHELLEFSEPDAVLSIYLNTDPSETTTDTYRLRLRNMLKDVTLKEDVAAIENFFAREYNWLERSIVVFSCAKRGFFRAYPLGVPVTDQITICGRPSVKKLADIMDNYGNYSVVLVDKQGSRFFFFHLGKLLEQEGIVGEEVRRTKRGGASTMPGRRGGTAGQTRYTEETIERNMKESASFADKFFDDNQVRHILVGGSEKNIALFRAQLPKRWQDEILGTFPMDMTATHQEVIERALQIGSEVETERENRVVQTLITAAKKGENAVIGLPSTIEAVNNQQVYVLVVSEGYEEKGFRCPSCNILTDHSENCQTCGSPIEVVSDSIELAVSDVLLHGGEVEVIHDNHVLEKAGRIGAMLRY
jgi:peptide chain release factor subunit 1